MFACPLSTLLRGLFAAKRRPLKNRKKSGSWAVLCLEILEDRLAPATFGLDVSSYQGAIDWSSVQAANGGQAFAIIKASQGTSSPIAAAYFATNAPEAISAGMVVGAYHFADPEANPTFAADPSNTTELLADADAEADYFAQVAGSYLTRGNLQPALDLEAAGFNNNFTPQEIATWATEWIAQLRREVPGGQLTPILYMDQNYAENLVGVSPSLTGYPLWIAAPNATRDPTIPPNTTAPWNTWAIHQYAAYPYLSTTAGIDEPVDLDVLNSPTSLNSLEIPPGIITTVAGNGSSGYSGDGGAATAAGLDWPFGVAVDAGGNIYIADTKDNRIREVSASTGIITNVAGNGSGGYSGDGGPATAAGLASPYGVAVDAAGNLYIADTYDNRIREVSASTGIITTIAGNGSQNDSGDGGPASAAELDVPIGVAVDAPGNLYIADYSGGRIREVSASTGIITTVAGNGTIETYSGDGGPATAAGLGIPTGVAVDAAGNLYIADFFDDVIREVSASTGIITTVAGNGSPVYSGDGGAATAAGLDDPRGVAVDAAGNLYISTTDDGRIREVSASTGIITTFAGNSSGGVYSGDGGPATAAGLGGPIGVAVDAAGNLYISTVGDNRIREVSSGLVAAAAPVVTVTSPKGGETWEPGIAHTITWSVTGDTSHIDNFLLSYSLDGGMTYLNDVGTASGTSRSMSWTPALVIPPTAPMSIRVEARDASNVVLSQNESDGTFALANPVSPSVTLITHGFNDNVSGWVSGMAEAIAQRLPNSSQTSIWTVTVTNWASPGFPPSLHVNTVTLDSGPNRFTQAYNGESIIELDWSSVADDPFVSTTQVASVVADYLLTTQVDGKTWLDVPFHLIGHSRGGSLVGELAKDLGQSGIWVDQVTTLDPHPVDGTHQISGLLYEPDWHDAPMTAWTNVSFWDNYWQNEAPFPQGDQIAGTDNVNLLFPANEGYPDSQFIGVDVPYSRFHADVHLWYQGTIDTSPSANDGSYPVPTDWYLGDQGPRDETGFYYTSIVGGSRPSDGLSPYLGGTATRQAISDLSQAVWPNVISLAMDSLDEQIAAGGMLHVTDVFEAFDSNVTTTFYLDPDENPYNSNAIAIGMTSEQPTGADPGTEQEYIDTSTAQPGATYFLCAKITDGTHTRYAFSPGSVTILPNQPPSPTALTSSANPSIVGQAVTLTTTVNGMGGTPTGTVTVSPR